MKPEKLIRNQNEYYVENELTPCKKCNHLCMTFKNEICVECNELIGWNSALEKVKEEINKSSKEGDLTATRIFNEIEELKKE